MLDSRVNPLWFAIIFKSQYTLLLDAAVEWLLSVLSRSVYTRAEDAAEETQRSRKRWNTADSIMMNEFRKCMSPKKVGYAEPILLLTPRTPRFWLIHKGIVPLFSFDGRDVV